MVPPVALPPVPAHDRVVAPVALPPVPAHDRVVAPVALPPVPAHDRVVAPVALLPVPAHDGLVAPVALPPVPAHDPTLSPFPIDACVYPMTVSIAGSINLNSCLSVVSSSVPVKNFNFVIDVSTTDRVYRLAADSKEERLDWVTTLKDLLFPSVSSRKVG